MQPTSQADYKQLLTDVIKKQIVILGPDITLSKARNVKGITVADDGTVTELIGAPQEITQALIDQFVQLSGLIVKKTMEPLLSMSQPATGSQEQLQQAPTQPAPAAVNQPLSVPVTDNMVPQTPVEPTPAQTVQPVTPQTTPTSPQPTPVETPAATQNPVTPATQQNPTAPLEVAKNPLAA